MHETTETHPRAPCPHQGPFSEFEEHGSTWLECVCCGAQWAIRGEALEQVSDGDGYCEEASG
jgi:hypothetical protein